MRSCSNLIVTIPTVLVIVLSGCSARPATDANGVGASPPTLNSAPPPLPPSAPQTPVSIPTPVIVPPPNAGILPDTLQKAPPTTAHPPVIPKPIPMPQKLAPVLPETPLPKPPTTKPTPTKPDIKNELPSDSKALALLVKKAPVTTPKIPAESKIEPAIAPAAPAPEAEPEIAVNFEEMPIKIQQWILDYEVIQNTIRVKCTLRSQAQTMDDGEGGTPVFLTFDGNSLKAVTKSNIDMEYSDDGLQIDLQPQRPIDRLHKETTAVFEQHWTELIQEMLHGRQAVLTFGFWPTWPMSRTYSVSFDLSHFPRAWRALEDCKQKS